MAWAYYTAPLAEGSRPNSRQLAELMAAFGERAAFQLNNFFSTTGFGLDSVKQPLLAATLLEGPFVFWSGDTDPPGSVPLHQPLDVAIGAVVGNVLRPSYSSPTDWWNDGTQFTVAAADLGVSWPNALAAMQAGLLNADYFNVCRHTMQLFTAYSFDGVTVMNPSWAYP